MALTQKTKEDWVGALRSGKYKQGKFVLRDKEDCYCCLGVLCEVHPDMEFDKKTTWAGGHTDAFPAINKLDGAKSLKSFPENLPLNITPAQHNSLVTMNDEEGLPFPEIADWIEKNVHPTPLVNDEEGELLPEIADWIEVNVNPTDLENEV